MLKLVIRTLALLALVAPRVSGAEPAKVTLVFSIDQGFGNGVVVQDDQVALKRIITALKPLSARYRVYVLLNPMVADRKKLNSVLDTLVAGKMPFVFDVYSSDSMTLGSCAEHCKPHDPNHGISISIDDLRAYKKRCGEWLAGIRFMEVFSQDFVIRAVKTTNPEWALPCWKLPKDSFFQPETAEKYLQFARENSMFVQFSDWHWFAFAEWDAPQKENEAGLSALLRKYRRLVTVTYANNEPDGQSPKRLPDWEKCIAKFKNDGAAGLGLSDQSWLSNDQTCPVEDIISWARSALDKGFGYVQFEPAWYFFKLPRGSFGLQDYTKDAAWADRGTATANLVALEKALLK